MRKMMWIVLTVLILIVIAAFVAVRCSGTDKTNIGERLAALAKNRELAAHGVQRKTARIELAGESHEVEFTFIHVPARAPSSSAPMVFVHGTPSTMFNWSSLLFAESTEAPLAGECDIYVLELLGHGGSNTESPPYNFQKCADWVRGFLVSLDLRDVTLIGQSYGGEFAWRAALDSSDRVAKLVLIGSSGYARPADGWLSEEVKLREWPGARLGYVFNSRERIRPALQLHFERDVSADQLEEMYWCCDNADNWRAMTELARDENGERERDIAQLRRPTLLLFGERDLAYPPERDGRRFERDIAGARLVIVPKAGHYAHEERVDVVRRELRAFHAGR